MAQDVHLQEIRPVRGNRSRVRYLLNRGIQWSMLVLLGQWAIYGLMRCPFVVPYVSCQNCPVITCHGRILQLFWGVWGGWVALALLFGRAFCGWACPGGLLTRIFSRLNPVNRQLSLPMDRSGDLNKGKYITLALVLFFYFYMGQPRINIPIRVGEFFPSFSLTFEHASDLWRMRTLFVVAGLLAGLAVSAAWCRFMCPGGGLLELMRRVSLFKVYKTGKCNGCNVCVSKCYMRTRPEEANCTNCGDCMDVCPQGCIGVGRKPE